MRYGNGDEPRDGSKQSADTSPKYGPLSNLPISIAHQCNLQMCTEKLSMIFQTTYNETSSC